MSMIKQLSRRPLFEWLWLGAPIVVWFAYQPLMRFGTNDTMYFELSITLIYLLILSVVSLKYVWQERLRLVNCRPIWLVEAVVIYTMLTLLWGVNTTRGVLSVGVIVMLYAILLGALAYGARFRRLVPSLTKIYIYSALVMCGVALVQFFAGIWLNQEVTLLCAGCVVEQFGFVRPNGFLIEPQFLGSALLPAALILTRQVVNRGDWRTWSGLGLTVTVLILTLSRGALLAFAVGVLVLLVVNRRQWLGWLRAAGLFVGSLIVALCLQGLAAAINPNINETFSGAVAKSINQLTMGVVNVEPPEEAELIESDGETEPAKADNQPVEPVFDGYVEESTTARTTRTELALRRWGRDLPTMLFGVGVGSAGLAIHQAYPDELGAREIVQNEYVERLLERGLVGLAGFAVLLVGVFWLTRKNKWQWSIIAAFMVQWLFFSGYPNALHIYLVMIVIVSLAFKNHQNSFQ